MNALLTAKHIISSIPFERISSELSMYPGNWIEHVVENALGTDTKTIFLFAKYSELFMPSIPFSPSLKRLPEVNFRPNL